MSLINDALKRAKQSQQQRQPTASGAPPLPPVEPEPRHGRDWLFPMLIVLLIAAAGFFVLLAFAGRKPPVGAATAPSVTQAVPTLSKPSPSATSQTVAVAVPQKPMPPALKVQGIFYNSTRPQAIVNGVTVSAGDKVDGFCVKLILQDKVLFIAPDGTEQTLALGE